MDYNVHVEGVEEATLRVRAVGANLRNQLQEVIAEAGHVVEDVWKRNIPYREGALYRSIEAGPVVFRPGAAGGGGFYEAEVKIGGTPETEHLRYVVEGTGIYGPKSDVIRRPGGGPMSFINDRGEKIFTQWTRGQGARDYWLELGIESGNYFIAERIRELDININR